MQKIERRTLKREAQRDTSLLLLNYTIMPIYENLYETPNEVCSCGVQCEIKSTF